MSKQWQITYRPLKLCLLKAFTQLTLKDIYNMPNHLIDYIISPAWPLKHWKQAETIAVSKEKIRNVVLHISIPLISRALACNRQNFDNRSRICFLLMFSTGDRLP